MSSLLAIHHDHAEVSEWQMQNGIEMVGTLKTQFAQAANEVLFAVQELIVQSEHSLESIAEYFGIHSFAHHIASKNLTGCTLVLTADHHLEIHRPDVAHVTRFPVIRKIAEAA